MNLRVWNCYGLGILHTGKELGDTIQAKDPSVVFVAKTLADEARLDRVVQEIEVQDKSLWMGIWSLYVLSKIKSFIWLACRKSLPTKQNLVRWTIINDPHCIRCCETKEHSIYAIWSYLLLDTVLLNTDFWACPIYIQTVSGLQGVAILDYAESPTASFVCIHSMGDMDQQESDPLAFAVLQPAAADSRV